MIETRTTTGPLVSYDFAFTYCSAFTFRTSYAGMTERRERKRAKRAIVQPLSDLESEQDGGSYVGRGKASRRAKGSRNNKKQQLFTGLALMHGIPATNVGKRRLTVRDTKKGFRISQSLTF